MVKKKTMFNTVCTVPDCNHSAFHRRYCKAHSVDPNRPSRDIRALRKHGLSRSTEYRIWHMMRMRCNNPNTTGFQNYGGRGISVCDQWNEFYQFYLDLGPRPSKNHSLERDDVDGNYEPSNCRWATKLEQSVNRRLSPQNTSGYRGVSWTSSGDKWLAIIKIDRKPIHIGSFKDKEEAAWMRDQWALELFGDYAPLNLDYQIVTT